MKIIQIAIPVLEPHERREFEKWRVAGPEEKERICRRLGYAEARKIIKDAEREAERRWPK